jgi:hypothetical protein
MTKRQLIEGVIIAVVMIIAVNRIQVLQDLCGGKAT